MYHIHNSFIQHPVLEIPGSIDKGSQANMTTISKIPIFVVLIVLEKLASTSFKDFFSFFTTWSTTQSRSTITSMLNSYPIQELYRWGNDSNMANRDLLLNFMDIAGSLQNKDALFYISFRIILQRNTSCYYQFNNAYDSLNLLANNNHVLSTLTVKVLDIYYFPERRQDAVINLARIATTHGTAEHIPRMILLLRRIAKSTWPNEIFTELFGPPVCQQHDSSAQRHYVPDGMFIQPSSIKDYACPQCKAAIIVACFASFS